MANNVNIKQKKTITAQQKVYEIIKERIIHGKVSDGLQLRQDDLAAEFGVSRIPVREALIQLDSEGLVKFYPYKGAVVSSLSPKEVWDIFDLRFILESTAIRSAADKITDDDFQKIEDIMLAQENEGELSPIERSNLNWDFHSSIYKLADRPKLYDIITSLHQSVDRYLRLYLKFGSNQKDSIESHRAILDSLKNGDIERAIDTLREHLYLAQEQIIHMLT